MELPRLTERALAATLIMATLLLLWAESRSVPARLLRAGNPWVVRINFTGDDGLKNVLAVYRPSDPSLAVVAAKDAPRAEGLFERLSPENAPLMSLTLLSGGPSGPNDDLQAIRSRIALSRPWDWLRGRENAGGFLNSLIWAFALARLKNDLVHAVRFPKDAASQSDLAARLLAPRTRSLPDSPSIEVLNASQRSGFALKAAKILRSRGLDVVNIANSPNRPPRTTIYGWTGDPEATELARRALACPGSVAETGDRLSRLVDVDVVLAGDCEPGQTRKSWNLSTY